MPPSTLSTGTRPPAAITLAATEDRYPDPHVTANGFIGGNRMESLGQLSAGDEAGARCFDPIRHDACPCPSRLNCLKQHATFVPDMAKSWASPNRPSPVYRW